MAFDLNPTLIKGSNKLKTLTRKLFNHETPELTDILKLTKNSANLEATYSLGILLKYSISVKEIEGNTKKNILVNTIKVIDYQMLCDSLDMSWYKTGDVLHKDYRTVKTIRDFELQVITPIILAALDAGNRSGELDLTLDTLIY